MTESKPCPIKTAAITAAVIVISLTFLAGCGKKNAADSESPPYLTGISNPDISLQTECKVTAIADGDTLTCLTDNKQPLRVRLSHIDAPEKHQAYGQKAKAALSSYVFGRLVVLSVSGKDRYDRTLAVVRAEGRNINLSMVQAGYAWAYRSKDTPDDYVQAETASRKAKAGLWRGNNPVYPGDFRHSR